MLCALLLCCAAHGHAAAALPLGAAGVVQMVHCLLLMPPGMMADPLPSSLSSGRSFLQFKDFQALTVRLAGAPKRLRAGRWWPCGESTQPARPAQGAAKHAPLLRRCGDAAHARPHRLVYGTPPLLQVVSLLGAVMPLVYAGVAFVSVLVSGFCVGFGERFFVSVLVSGSQSGSPTRLHVCWLAHLASVLLLRCLRLS